MESTTISSIDTKTIPSDLNEIIKAFGDGGVIAVLATESAEKAGYGWIVTNTVLAAINEVDDIDEAWKNLPRWRGRILKASIPTSQNLLARRDAIKKEIRAEIEAAWIARNSNPVEAAIDEIVAEAGRSA